MQNVMAIKNGVFTPRCTQFKQCEILCIICWGKKLNLESYLGTPHISSSHLSSQQLSLSPLLPSLAPSSGPQWYLLHKPNKAPHLVTSPKSSQAKVLTGGRRFGRSTGRRHPVCQPFPRLSAQLGSVTDILSLTGNILTLTILESG